MYITSTRRKRLRKLWHLSYCSCVLLFPPMFGTIKGIFSWPTCHTLYDGCPDGAEGSKQGDGGMEQFQLIS